MSRVTFARINRRQPDQPSLATRPFKHDMLDLAEAKKTEAMVKGKLYIASDLELDPSGDFLTGVMGFEEQDEFRTFDREAYSWRKAETFDVSGASGQNLVPFAVDLREGHRWVAFGSAQKIRHQVFTEAFAAALNAAVGELGLFPSEWEVDLVTSTSTVKEWVLDHPDVSVFVRVVRLTNPGRDLDEQRQAMRALGAATTQERYTPPYGKTLNVKSEVFDHMLEGMETGDTEIRLDTRSGDQFTTADRPDSRVVDNYAGDLDRGIQLVLGALVDYVTAKE